MQIFTRWIQHSLFQLSSQDILYFNLSAGMQKLFCDFEKQNAKRWVTVKREHYQQQYKIWHRAKKWLWLQDKYFHCKLNFFTFCISALTLPVWRKDLCLYCKLICIMLLTLYPRSRNNVSHFGTVNEQQKHQTARTSAADAPLGPVK